MAKKSKNGRSLNGAALQVEIKESAYELPEFNRYQQLEISFNRKRHIEALDLMRRSNADVVRIISDGPTLPQDVELVRAMAVLSLWEVREQHFLHRMYLANG